LYFYGARWYDSYLNRWAQPDSILPLASQGTQAYDRYAYVNNSPVNYTDPTGHMLDDGCRYEGCDTEREKENFEHNPVLERLKGGKEKTEKEKEDFSKFRRPSYKGYKAVRSEAMINGQMIAGGLLIVFADLFVGIPAAAVIVMSGGATPPALAAELLEVGVVLPVTALGIYLIATADR
jgi:hypothetical protein